MSDGEILDHFPVSTFIGQREWSVTSFVDCTCTSVLNVAAIADKAPRNLISANCLL